MRIPRPSRQRNRSRASSLCLCMIASSGTQRSGCCPPRSLTTASDIVHRPALSTAICAPAGHSAPYLGRRGSQYLGCHIAGKRSGGEPVGSHVGWTAAVAWGLWWNRKALAEPCMECLVTSAAAAARSRCLVAAESREGDVVGLDVSSMRSAWDLPSHGTTTPIESLVERS